MCDGFSLKVFTVKSQCGGGWGGGGGGGVGGGGGGGGGVFKRGINAD